MTTTTPAPTAQRASRRRRTDLRRERRCWGHCRPDVITGSCYEAGIRPSWRVTGVFRNVPVPARSHRGRCPHQPRSAPRPEVEPKPDPGTALSACERCLHRRDRVPLGAEAGQPRGDPVPGRRIRTKSGAHGVREDGTRLGGFRRRVRAPGGAAQVGGQQRGRGREAQQVRAVEEVRREQPVRLGGRRAVEMAAQTVPTRSRGSRAAGGPSGPGSGRSAAYRGRSGGREETRSRARGALWARRSFRTSLSGAISRSSRARRMTPGGGGRQGLHIYSGGGPQHVPPHEPRQPVGTAVLEHAQAADQLVPEPRPRARSFEQLMYGAGFGGTQPHRAAGRPGGAPGTPLGRHPGAQGRPPGAGPRPGHDPVDGGQEKPVPQQGEIDVEIVEVDEAVRTPAPLHPMGLGGGDTQPPGRGPRAAGRG